jgi:hypothetical protein
VRLIISEIGLVGDVLISTVVRCLFCLITLCGHFA